MRQIDAWLKVSRVSENHTKLYHQYLAYSLSYYVNNVSYKSIPVQSQF
jgi:hypothetical protein